MEQVKKLLGSLSQRQWMMIGAVTLLTGAAIAALVTLRGPGEMKTLYSGLAPEDAGPVVQKLKEKKIEYKLDEQGGAIQVPAAKVAELRLEMASAGLPKSGRIGFELFDKSRFGASDLTEKVNLRRAVEGELERSVASLSEVETARVHVTYPRDSVFAENRLPAKASVMVRLKPGRKLEEQAVSAVRFLVASAVEGLQAEAVSVLDMEGHVLGRPRDKTAMTQAEANDAALEYRRKIERDLLVRMDETVEALLGPSRYRNAVVVDCDFTSGEQSEESFDPNRSVMTTSERTRESTAAATPGGVPGTASNLPRPTTPMTRSNGFQRETENINYQSARTVRRLRLPEGKITRLSASVLVDQTLQWVPNGNGFRRVLTPPPPDTLRRISDVVGAAIGLQPERGDRLVVDSLPFDTTLSQPPPPATPAQPSPFDRLPVRSPAAWTALAAAAAILIAAAAAAAARTRRSRRQAARKHSLELREDPMAAAAAAAALGPASGSDASPSSSSGKALGPGENPAMTQLERQLEERRRRRDFEKHALQAEGAVIQDLIKELQEAAKADPALCAGAMRSWLLIPDRSEEKIGVKLN